MNNQWSLKVELILQWKDQLNLKLLMKDLLSLKNFMKILQLWKLKQDKIKYDYLNL